jgi:hypothetical protein
MNAIYNRTAEGEYIEPDVEAWLHVVAPDRTDCGCTPIQLYGTDWWPADGSYGLYDWLETHGMPMGDYITPPIESAIYKAIAGQSVGFKIEVDGFMVEVLSYAV